MKPLTYLLPVIAYLYGSVPFGFLMAKLVRGVDIRETGSGNIGATNAARVLGFRYFPLVFLLDFSKGFLPTLAAVHLAGNSAFSPSPLAAGTALAAVLGHVFPLYLQFKGGKAVATGTGVCVVLAHWAVLAAVGTWAAVFLITRYVSLASICAAAILAAGAWTLHAEPMEEGVWRTAFCTVAGLMVIVLHHGNIRRLLKGTEHKIGGGEESR